jgi:hypothetical protein
MAGPRLIDLQTDLKSLRYGSDKPYITKDINNPPSSNQTGMQITKRIDDLSRIGQMLIDRPGLKFIGNQALLQQVNIQDKLQKSRDKGKTLGGAILQQALGTLKQTAKILGSTIAQVPVNGTGTHFVYAFRTDTYLQPTGGNNRSAFAQFFGAGGVEGAPLALQGKPITGKVESNFGEPNQQTGEFKLTTESELDYDEKVNTQIPQGENRVYSQQGTPIIEDNVGIDGWKPYTSTGLRENFVDRNSNQIVSESKFSTPELSKKTRVKPSGSIVNVTSAEIFNPFTGDPLTISGIETTASPNKDIQNPQNKIKSVSNTKVVGSGLPLSDTNQGKQYTPENTYTTLTSVDTITKASNGSTIALDKNQPEINYRPNGFVVERTPGEITVEEITNSETGDVAAGPSLGEKRVPDKISLKKLQEGIISGSIETVAGERAYVNPVLQDFRKGQTYYFNYGSPTINKETRVNLGNQGKVSFNREQYSNIDPDTIDTINALGIQTDERAAGNDQGRDLAKFYFEIITPEKRQFLHFRAFIDSIDDNYNADWQGFKYVGRADSFYTYGGFERDINISFKIAAATRSEMKPLYQKMVLLASSTAPTYGGQGFMRGTLARLTVGSYFSQLPGVITSVKYSLIDDMPWELSMQSPEQGGDSDVQELPMGLQCNISYKVIHDFAPQTGLYHYFTNPNPVNAQDFLK